MGNPLYTIGEGSRAEFGFVRRDDEASGQSGTRAGGRDVVAGTEQSAAQTLFTFSDIEKTQVLAVNVSDSSPLLKRSDKCCTAKRFDAGNCCKPHAVFWQSG